MQPQQSAILPVQWRDDALHLLDQRVLPGAVEYVVCTTSAEVAAAVRAMVVRGAPAIGIAAAYAVVLSAARQRQDAGWRDGMALDLEQLRAARPTAVNLAWAIDRMAALFADSPLPPHDALLTAARALHDADIEANRAMGAAGATLLSGGDAVLTHCNAGALATGGYGTALGVIRSGHDRGLISAVYATETRPWLQGARLTAWELLHDGIDVTLLADSAAASLMRAGRVQWVITGADRIAANGDTANKVGTYALANLARIHGVRMMVVAPLSTVDRATPDGDSIPIEERGAEELTALGRHTLAPDGAQVFNPVFDVTPAALIDVLVTEKGAVERPDRDAIAALFET